jgi:hypothetical protein
LQSLAFTSALLCSKRRQTSSWPLAADQCRGVRSLKKSKRINALHEHDGHKWVAEVGREELQSVSLVDAIRISNHMAKHRSAVSDLYWPENVGSACNSSLHKNERRCALDAAAGMQSNAPQNQLALAAERVKHTAQASTGTTSAAHSTARAPLQPHLHFLHATPRHTLHHHLNPDPWHAGHVHIGRRKGKSLAHERRTGQHETHSPTRRTFRDYGAKGRQRSLPTVMLKKPLLAFDDIDRALDLRAKLLWRRQLVDVGVNGNEHASAGEAIETNGKWESCCRHFVQWCDLCCKEGDLFQGKIARALPARFHRVAEGGKDEEIRGGGYYGTRRLMTLPGYTPRASRQ